MEALSQDKNRVEAQEKLNSSPLLLIVKPILVSFSFLPLDFICFINLSFRCDVSQSDLHISQQYPFFQFESKILFELTAQRSFIVQCNVLIPRWGLWYMMKCWLTDPYKR